MKLTRAAILPLVVAAVLAAGATGVQAQTLTVSLNVDSNPPAEISQWTSGEAIAFMTIRANSVPQQIIKAEVTVTIMRDGNRVALLVSTIDIDSDLEVVEWRDLVMSGALNVMEYNPADGNQVVRSNRLPSGRYEFCADVVVQGTNNVTVQNGNSCSPFTIAHVRPPRLRFPRNGGEIYENERPRFEWSPMIGADGSTSYRFVLTKVNRDQRQTPTNAFRGNWPICDTVVQSTTFHWPAVLPLPDTGLYVWSVRATNGDEEGHADANAWASPYVLSVADRGTAFRKLSDSPSGSMLFTNTTEAGEWDLRAGPEYVRSQNIIVKSGLLRPDTIVSAEFLNDTIQIKIANERQLNDMVVWTGTVVGDDESYVVFVAKEKGEIPIGNIIRGGTLYQVRFFGKGIHKLIEIHPSAFTREADPVVPQTDTLPSFTEDYPNTDPPDRIDVMVLYTRDARKVAGGNDLIELEIALAMAETNLSYENSGIGHRLELVHATEVFHAESENLDKDLDWLRADDDVRALRDRYAADIVILMVERSDNDRVGLAEIMPYLHPYAERFGFGVVKRSAATAKYTFGHEIGHIMGCVHDCGQDEIGSALFQYSHGYRDTVKKWGTIMAPERNGYRRLPLYSDPGMKYGDRPVGTMQGACTSCEACVLEITAPVVANYRTHRPGVQDVYVKDAWNDGGEEPNELDSSRFPWSAPLIITLRDSGYAFDPRRRILEPGKPRWVSVTLQNGGGDTASGDLKLYYREASLSAVWDSSWTLLSSTRRQIPPVSSKTFVAPWTNVPGDGHYSIVARWVSATDTMYAAETARLLDNVLLNNNIAWKNEYLLELTPFMKIDSSQNPPRVFNSVQASAEVDFQLIANSTIEVICGKAILGETTFADATTGGSITMKVDPAVGRQLAEEGSPIDVRRTDSSTFRITGRMGGTIRVVAGDGRVERMTIDFARTTTSPATFPVHIVQKSADGSIIGGVSYLLFFPLDKKYSWDSVDIERGGPPPVTEAPQDETEEADGASPGSIALFAGGYKPFGNFPQHRPESPFMRFVLNPSLRLSSRFSIPPMIAFATRTSNVVTPAPQSSPSFLQTLASPANNIGLSLRFGAVGIDLGSHTPEVSPLIGSSVQLFGLGLALSPGNFRLALSGGLSQAAVDVDNVTTAGSYARGMIVGRLGWESERTTAGVNLLYALDDTNSIGARDDSVLYRTFEGGAMQVMVKWSRCYQPGERIPVNNIWYRVLNDSTLMDDSNLTSVGNELHFNGDSTWVRIEGAIPAPKQNLVLSVDGAVLLNDAVSVEGEIAGALFTGDTRVGRLTDPKLLSNEIISTMNDFAPIKISTRLDLAARLKVKINAENGKPWNLEIGSEYLGPGYLSLGHPYMEPDRLAVTALAGADLFDGDLSMSGLFGWRRNNMTGTELTTENELSMEADLLWRPSYVFSLAAGYAGAELFSPIKTVDVVMADVGSYAHEIRISPSYVLKADIGENHIQATATVGWGGEKIGASYLTSGIDRRRTDVDITGFYSLRTLTGVSADVSLSALMRNGSAGFPRTAGTPELTSIHGGSIGFEFPDRRGRLTLKLQAAVSRYVFDRGGAGVQAIVKETVNWKLTGRLEFKVWGEINRYVPGAFEGKSSREIGEIMTGLEMKWKL